MHYTEILIKAGLAIFLVPVLGAFLMGLDRRITARMQGRVGPPLLQPIYDVLKLFSKQAIFLNRMQIMYAFLHLAFMISVVLLLVFGQDMLLVLFVHAFATIALILGGMCVRSPYSRIGSQRKTLLLLAYEPILVLMVVGIYLTNGSFMASTVVTTSKPLLLSMPLIFVTYLIAMAIELQKSPFDVATSHHAHQELVKGVTLEYAGPYLGIIELAHFYEVFMLFAIVAMFWAQPIYVGIALAAVVFVAQAVLDNTFARLTSMWILKFMWTVVLGLAVVNVLILTRTL